eukprot:6855353-Alexandrium_andersonii.AAC.1
MTRRPRPPRKSASRGGGWHCRGRDRAFAPGQSQCHVPGLRREVGGLPFRGDRARSGAAFGRSPAHPFRRVAVLGLLPVRPARQEGGTQARPHGLLLKHGLRELDEAGAGGPAQLGGAARVLERFQDGDAPPPGKRITSPSTCMRTASAS